MVLELTSDKLVGPENTQMEPITLLSVQSHGLMNFVDTEGKFHVFHDFAFIAKISPMPEIHHDIGMEGILV